MGLFNIQFGFYLLNVSDLTVGCRHCLVNVGCVYEQFVHDVAKISNHLHWVYHGVTNHNQDWDGVKLTKLLSGTKENELSFVIIEFEKV